MRFMPKHDWWQAGFFVAVLGVTTGLVLAGEGTPLAAQVLLLVLDGFALWILLGSYYQLTERGLRVAFGPFRLTYPYAEMAHLRRGGWWAQVSSLRHPRLRLAFSTDNVILESRRGKLVRRVVISPRHKDRFLQLLKEQAPHLEMEV